jgi:hypothetical protein
MRLGSVVECLCENQEEGWAVSEIGWLSSSCRKMSPRDGLNWKVKSSIEGDARRRMGVTSMV